MEPIRNGASRPLYSRPLSKQFDKDLGGSVPEGEDGAYDAYASGPPDTFEQEEIQTDEELFALDREGEEGEEESDGARNASCRELSGRISRFVHRTAPLLQRIARQASPLVSSAVERAFKRSRQPFQPVEDETVFEAAQEPFEHEYEYVAKEDGKGWEQDEFAAQDEWETSPVSALSQPQQAAAILADAAAQAPHETEAAALIAAATISLLPVSDRVALQSLLPALVRGAATLTRLLRQRRGTRPAVRTIPFIVQQTAATLTKHLRTGRSVSVQTAAQTFASQTRQMLGQPDWVEHILQQTAYLSQGGIPPMQSSGRGRARPRSMTS